MKTKVNNTPKKLTKIYCDDVAKKAAGLNTRSSKKTEEIILKANPRWMLWYHARMVRYNQFPNKVWPEAEEIAYKNNTNLYDYCTNIGDFTLFRKKILQEPVKEAARWIYRYCCRVNQRWPEAEEIIFQDSKWAARYASKFKILLPESAHNQILMENVFTKKEDLYLCQKTYMKKFQEIKNTTKGCIEQIMQKHGLTENDSISKILSELA